MSNETSRAVSSESSSSMRGSCRNGNPTSVRAQLRALAERAMPGPWEVDRNTPFSQEIMGIFHPVQRRYVVRVDDGHEPVTDDDAAYIAAVSPDVVLALLDEIAALEAAVEWEWGVDYTVPRGRTFTNGLKTFTSETHARLAAPELLDGKLIRRRRAGSWEIVR